MKRVQPIKQNTSTYRGATPFHVFAPRKGVLSNSISTRSWRGSRARGGAGVNENKKDETSTQSCACLKAVRTKIPAKFEKRETICTSSLSSVLEPIQSPASLCNFATSSEPTLSASLIQPISSSSLSSSSLLPSLAPLLPPLTRLRLPWPPSSSLSLLLPCNVDATRPRMGGGRKRVCRHCPMSETLHDNSRVVGAVLSQGFCDGCALPNTSTPAQHRKIWWPPPSNRISCNNGSTCGENTHHQLQERVFVYAAGADLANNVIS